MPIVCSQSEVTHDVLVWFLEKVAEQFAAHFTGPGAEPPHCDGVEDFVEQPSVCAPNNK